jgi:prepilin-type N-terminal cleavage/methylation domain-containing protein
MKRRGFTLVEMLLASVLAVVLMLALLTMLSGVSRDGKRLRAGAGATSATPYALPERVRWDLVNAQTLELDRNGGGRVILVGHSAIERQTLTSSGRLVQVTYRTTPDGCLVREQESLDNPANPDRWSELLAAEVRGFRLTPESIDALAANVGEGISTTAITVPSRVRLHIETVGWSIDRELWIK